MKRTTTLGCALVALALGACADDGETPRGQVEQAGTDDSALVDGTPESVGLLSLLNAPETTFEVLDDDVPLDKRAAENLIAHRDGPDAVHGTGDDDRFDDVAEVDAVSWVGPAAMDALLAYAASQGYVPAGDDLLGVYDDVAFTVDEAEATLDLVNNAPASELDFDVGLDSRAVGSILEARPVLGMVELEGLYFVGPAAMLALRDYAISSKKGIWESCHGHDECLSGLCAGLILFDGNGWCFESWQADSFENDSPVAIPDDGTLVTRSIEVSGLATVPLDVVVTLDIDHPRPEDLHVALHQPGGAYAVLWDHQAAPPSVIEKPNGIEGDNMVNGTWTLDVVDTVTGESGQVNGWSMWISSTFD